VMSTREIMEQPGPWHTRVVAPIDTGHANVPIDPYTLGALLGDGHFGISARRGARGAGKRPGGGIVLACHEEEREVIDRIAAALPAGHEVSGRSGRYTLIATQGPGVNRVGSNVLAQSARSLGLAGKTATEKHIPRVYFRTSAENRIELLRGLMDTDGYVNATGAATFTTISPDLAAGVVELVRSLGGLATMTCRLPYSTAKYPAYRIGIRTPFTPFHMTRKAERYERSARHELIRTIKRIEPAGVTECQCIEVAAADCLYVTQDYVLTHNTFCTVYLTEYPGDELGLRRIVGHLSTDVLADYVHLAEQAIAQRAGRVAPSQNWLREANR
jgi:hypothetical protein